MFIHGINHKLKKVFAFALIIWILPLSAYANPSDVAPRPSVPGSSVSDKTQVQSTQAASPDVSSSPKIQPPVNHEKTRLPVVPTAPGRLQESQKNAGDLQNLKPKQSETRPMGPLPPQGPMTVPPANLPPVENMPRQTNIPPASSVAAERTLHASKGNVSLNFDDADVYSVIQTVFGEILKVNYIVDSRVKGRVTFRSVAPVPREKVLPLMEVILRLNGVAIIVESELYRIIPISDLSREPSSINIGRKMLEADLKGKAVLQIVPLNYVQSSEIVKLINPFVSNNAVIVDVPKANHIIIADTDANLKRILHIIEYFDAEMKEKKGVRVFVHHVQNTTAKDVVTMLQQIYLGAKEQTTDRAVKPAATPQNPPPQAQRQPVNVSTQSGGTDAIVSDAVKIFADEKLNAVVILGTREDYDIIRDTIKELDLMPRQVLIEGTIASILLTDKMSLGLSWAIKNKFLNFETFDVSFNPATLNAVQSKGASASGLNFIGIDSLGSVRVVINALASQSKAKLLASPHIMVADNNEARIQVGQQVPIPTSETYGAVGVVPQRTIQYKDIGVILKVKPLINDSGFVTLEIAQEVSTYSKDILYSDETQIILNKTEATTKLIVKDGHTIVIGGLIREDDSKARAGIPWLSKIPILGLLFGNTDTDKTRTELVILLTPHIVKDQRDAAFITDEFVDKFKDRNMSDDIQKSMKDGKPEKADPEE